MERGEIKLRYGANGEVDFEIHFVDGTVWLTKSEMAQIFGVFIQRVTANLRVLFDTKELFEHLNVRRHRGVVYYNFDAVIALAYKMRGGYCHLFRRWVVQRVRISLQQRDSVPIYITMSGCDGSKEN